MAVIEFNNHDFSHQTLQLIPLHKHKMKSLIYSVLLCLALPLMASAQTTAGSILPHKILPGSAKLRIAVAETVQEVVLESKPKGSKTWTTQKVTVKNLPGGTEVLLDVPKNLRQQDLRAKVLAVRSAPQAVGFTANKAKSELQVSAGLAGGVGVSVEYFDSGLKQWKRFATALAPKDRKKTWSISVPAARRSALLRITRLDSKTPGTVSSRFPASFRTGKTNFPGREMTNSSAGNVHLSSSSVNSVAGKSSDSAQKSDVQESDIWKVSGNRIYFFNQLRGLQVIDTTNPADPEIVSSLRMPAVGEDMYVLSKNRALLVRRDWTNGGTTGLVLVDPSKPHAKILAELQVPGWYVDSRLVNGRLVLATTEWNTESWQMSTRVSIVEKLSSKPVVSANATLSFNASAMGVGSDYLWFSGTQGWAWDRSRVALFPITGLPKIENPLEIDLGGVIYDKFKIHENGGTLFAVTQSWGAGWRQSTALESYSLADQKPALLQRLVLIEGESLHATRFDGDRAYIVTFQQIDPLWIVDLSSPADMRIEAELEVPGWSTFIQPVEGYLAAVGVENGKVTASLFDVRNPANPSLSSRVEVGDGYSWSEANWNEKAVSILPESGLILLPYSSLDANGVVSAVQLVDMNIATGSLVKRGVVKHAFSPRRASRLRDGLIASISNRELMLLDATNRDKPALLADVALAFGADRILGVRDGMLVHAESGDWGGSAAALRVSPLIDPDSVVSQAELGDGEILAASLEGRHIAILLRNLKNPDEASLIKFDAGKLPALVETGRLTFKLSSGWNSKVDLVWPAPDLVVAAIRRQTWNWWRGPVIMPAATPRRSLAADIAIWPPHRSGDESLSLHAFDFTAAVPKASSIFDLASISPRNSSAVFAADGLVVFSSDSAKEAVLPNSKQSSAQVLPNGTTLFSISLPPVSSVQPKRYLDHSSLRIVDYANPQKPFLWPSASLPGQLQHITEFDRSAGLIFATNASGGLEALLFEAGAAHAIATIPESSLRAFAGRSVWGFASGKLSRLKLSDSGAFVTEGTRQDLALAPFALKAHAGGLLAQNAEKITRVPLDFSAPLKSLAVPGWGWWWSSDLSLIQIAGDSVIAPAGDYGIEVLK
jgi:hypothetical protein